MQGVKSQKPLTEFGMRVQRALDAENRKATSTEAEAGISKGYLGRMMRGERGATALDPQKVKALARLLHVEFEWLFIGEGPMRKGGRGETPAERAIVFARGYGAREDAIQRAWERNKDREGEMTEPAWIDAIEQEVAMLERAGIPRPEVTHAARAAVRREKKKLERAKERQGEADDGSIETARKRASGGL